MKTFLGPFHPHLENALVEAVREHKAKSPLSPLLILAPSDSLRRRIKICFAAENRMNLLNTYTWTFHQLYLRLNEESQSSGVAPAADDSIIQEALSHWIKAGGLTTESFVAVGEKAGGCAALWQTLRDLKDGGVDPTNLRNALEEGLCEERDRKKLASLVELYASFSESLSRWGLYDYADFVASLRGSVGSSAFLSQFDRILYYGFYDLTQIQLDVFHEIVRYYPTTLFFPLVRGHPAWVFAQRFYEQYLKGWTKEEEDLCRLGSGSCSLALFADHLPPEAPQIACGPSYAIISCSGPRDEILTVAKEILRLNRDEGLEFSQVGVVARTLEPYTDWVKEIFRDHCIPISTTAEEPLLKSPLAKAVILLLALASKDYFRSHFVDLVSSPFFNLGILLRGSLRARPDLWDILTRRLGITKGADEWARLRRYLGRVLEFSADNEDDDGTGKITVASEQIDILWRLFTELNGDLSGLPPEASWTEYVSSWKDLLRKYLNLNEEDALTAQSSDRAIRTTILETLRALCALDGIRSKPSRSQFVQTLQRALERKVVPIAERNTDGVIVLDAMAARGARFRTLFLVGLNEGLFPRIIREDAFLRDRTRRVMETALGYKISEKLAAFDEEKLLFALVIAAASDRLYCLYQRSDDSGRVLEPSWYLAELARALAAANHDVAITVIPRGIRDKKDVEPFRSSDLLMPEELAIRLGLEGEDTGSLVKSLPGTNAPYLSGSKLLDVLEDPNGSLSPHDGLTGHLPEYWRDLQLRGLSPSAIERYARCPFQFFASHILSLLPLKPHEKQTAIDSSEKGKLVHEILKTFFQQLIDAGFFGAAGKSVQPEKLLEAAARRTFCDYESQNPVGYPLIWDVFQEQIIALLREQLEHDLNNLRQSGRRPVALEVEVHGKLPPEWPGPAAGLPIYGAIDRIDFDEMNASYRVIDYKFTMKKKPSTADSNLLLGAMRGGKLQPPIYLLLAKEFVEEQEDHCRVSEAALCYLAPRWEEGANLQATFSADNLGGSLGLSLRETISLLVRGIHDGLYFFQPGDACRNCDVTHVCRKNHLPSLWRKASDPLTQPYEDILKKNLAKE